MLKRALKTDFVRGILTRLASAYMAFVHATSRWTEIGVEYPRAYWDKGAPFIFAFWHGRILMGPFVWTPKGRGRLKVIISKHRDGDLITNSVKPFGIGAIRGSAGKPGKDDKGGAAALRAMLKELKAGGCVGFTPDGPRGPAFEASEGVIQLARLSGAPVIPFAYSSSRSRLMNSWDRFMVALPFGRGYYVWGAPIEIPRNLEGEELEAARLKIEAALNAVTAEADRLAGRDSPVPLGEKRLAT